MNSLRALLPLLISFLVAAAALGEEEGSPGGGDLAPIGTNTPTDVAGVDTGSPALASPFLDTIIVHAHIPRTAASSPVEDIHFTPGNPLGVEGGVRIKF